MLQKFVGKGKESSRRLGLCKFILLISAALVRSGGTAFVCFSGEIAAEL